MNAIANKNFPTLDGATLRRASTKASNKHGCSLVIEADGSVLSMQPDGSQQTRPAGTDGGYEQCILNGNFAVYCPDGISVYAVPFFRDVP